MYILYCVYIILLIYAIELFAYIWHRYISHSDIIVEIHEIHKKHHGIDLSDNNTSDEDFILVMLLLIFFEIIAGLITLLNILPNTLIIITIVVSIITFYWNNYIHTAYHQEHHWLNSYEWFKRDKELHYLHHYCPTKNFGIMTHFNDKIFGSYQSS